MRRITDYLINARANCPEKIGMLSQVSSYTYEDIYKYSNYIAEYLKLEYKLNCDLVIIHACNSCELGIIMYALLAANCTVIPVSVVCSDQELDYIINDSKSILVISDEYTTNKYQHIYTDSQMNIESVTRLISLAKQNASDLPMTQADKEIDNELAFIIYSSGSTGKLKGIECTHKAILFAVHGINEFIRNNEKDTVLCVLPFSFDYGLYQLFLVAEVYATAFIHSQIFNALQLPYLIEKNQITGFPALPMWLKMLLENNRIDVGKMSSLRYITSTGDTLKVSLIDEFSKKMPHLEILCMYGLTECKRVSILPWEDYQTHKGSVGLPLRGTAVRIVDENGADVPTGEIGELVVRGPHLMQGYFHDEELTKDRYRYNNEYNEIELFTGDIFKMDQQGYLYYITRTQFYIKKRGQRISPLFIEDTLNKIPNVIESAVVPLRVADDELAVGFIRINTGTYTAAILSDIKKSLPKVHQLDYAIFYDKFFPHTPNGKIDRKALIDKAKLLYLDNRMSDNGKEEGIHLIE